MTRRPDGPGASPLAASERRGARGRRRVMLWVAVGLFAALVIAAGIAMAAGIVSRMM